ncbi:DUF5067 domain-containing protein [Levilactobacillus cerevisiae]|uniref:DUF5067 domain-containing protein n=1 Tax=Levilactobacillus cerevisiae TaxID=1704076 RepID=UPI000F79CC58|nr:DUF5067 domain-containing protein [Levilactobacillus cerevisiae]
MSHVKSLVVLGSLLLLTGCGATNKSAAKTPSSQQEPASSKSSQATSSSKTQQSSRASSSSSVAKTATFSNQTFTINHVAFKLTGSKVTASATANRNLFVIYYTVTNNQGKSIIPSDLWQSAVSASQNGKKLGTGNLAFTTSQTTDNNKLNRTVMPVNAGKSTTGLAMFEPKGTQNITVTFKDTNGQTVHTSTYPLS